LPAEQEKQADNSVVFPNLPRSQFKHVVCPCKSMYLPSTQELQVVGPLLIDENETRPTEQREQMVFPVVAANRPFAQFMQFACPDNSLNLPELQDKHVLLPSKF
jgi:hypothetical protein